MAMSSLQHPPREWQSVAALFSRSDYQAWRRMAQDKNIYPLLYLQWYLHLRKIFNMVGALYQLPVTQLFMDDLSHNWPVYHVCLPGTWTKYISRVSNTVSTASQLNTYYRIQSIPLQRLKMWENHVSHLSTYILGTL